MSISSIHNPNIMPLVGFCINPEQGILLVYKYVSHGSMERYLHDKKWRKNKKKGKKASVLRHKVALGIANTIEYLHNGIEQCVVHRDIKPSNRNNLSMERTLQGRG